MKPRLTLAELESFDNEPMQQGEWTRFLCPFGECADKPADKYHKSLAVKGAFFRCFRCGVSGFFRDVEHTERPQVAKKKQAPPWWSQLS